MNKTNNVNISDEIVLTKIYVIRGQKVMIDRDLAELYGVETRRLKEAVRRNISRFPEDFMFELTKEEFSNWRSQIATSNSDIMGLRYLPFCFTEQGVTMLSCVLNSERAISVNIHIMRVFTRMREMLGSHTEIIKKIEELENKDTEQDDKIKVILEYIKQLEKTRQDEKDFKDRPRIGFKK